MGQARLDSNRCTDGKRSSSGVTKVGIEENILAILDDAQETQHSHDDRIAFLEAVRATSIVANDGIPPTNKMLETIFQIFRTGKSLELIIASFRLLNELEQNFPRVHSDAGVASQSSSCSAPQLIVDKEAWSPFALNLDSERANSNESSTNPIDPLGFHLLIQELAGMVNDIDVQPADTKSLRNMLLVQYLVKVLEEEFLVRSSIYKDNKQWPIIRESTLNVLLGSRRVSYKGLVKDCLSVVCGLHKVLSGCSDGRISSEDSLPKSSKDVQSALAIALVEVEEGTCVVMQKFMMMIMELDVLKQQADADGFTTRADSPRTPLMEILVDELTYDNEILSPVLQVLKYPKWKLELVLQYFTKYSAKPAVRTRRASDTREDYLTFHGILRSLANINGARSIVKKIGAESVQLLLAHGFQAHIGMCSNQYQSDGIPDSSGDSSLMEICREMISAFNSLRKTDGGMEILPIAREALFVASTILSSSS